MRLLLTIALFVCLPLATQNKSSTTYVYICTGKSAYSYHRTDVCSGLNNCHARIKRVSIDYAESIKRKPCKKCYK